MNTIVGNRTVASLLHELAERDPDRPMLVAEDLARETSTWTRAEVLSRSLAMAQILTENGVGQGDRVHIHMANRPEFLFTWFACALLGAVLVPTNAASSGHEIAFVASHSAARLTVTEAAHSDRASATGLPMLIADRITLDGPAHRPSARVSSGDDAAVLYTSGTTANPKGVRVTHANYVWAGEVVAQSLRITERDRILIAMPLFHGNAQYYSTLPALVTGACLVLLPRFSATRYLSQARRHRATVGSLFAAPIRMILAQQPRPDWTPSTLRLVVFAQNITDAEHDRWAAATGVPLAQLYGMTETIAPPLMNPIDGTARPHAMGRPTLGYHCRVVRDDGSDAAIGEAGQLLVAGTPGISLMSGYLDDPDATAATLRDGWLHTGDIARIDADGFFSFVDRRKDMIRRAGENVAASEVEAVLLAHPHVADAAVVGIPDAIRDEAIIAFVVPHNGLDRSELNEWCQQRLAAFRVPSEIHLRRELPRTSVGKIQKRVLRDEITASMHRIS
jgi:crotonobetaine/carnitine-CoA ligase